jgi:hypothetical protein
MKIMSILILSISTLKVAGQNHLWGVECGFNSTNITSNFLSQSDSRTGLTAGLTYNFIFKKHFSIGADFIYIQRGFTNDIIYTDNLGNTIEKNKTKFNYEYISLPIKTGLNIGNKLYGFTNVGVVPALLVDATSPILDTDGKLSGNEIFNVTNRVSKFDFAGLLEIGSGYKFNGRYWLYTSFSFQHSFTTITNSGYFANRKIQHNGINFTIGLKCALTKE